MSYTHVVILLEAGASLKKCLVTFGYKLIKKKVSCIYVYKKDNLFNIKGTPILIFGVPVCSENLLVDRFKLE